MLSQLNRSCHFFCLPKKRCVEAKACQNRRRHQRPQETPAVIGTGWLLLCSIPTSPLEKLLALQYMQAWASASAVCSHTCFPAVPIAILIWGRYRPLQPGAHLYKFCTSEHMCCASSHWQRKGRHAGGGGAQAAKSPCYCIDMAFRRLARSLASTQCAASTTITCCASAPRLDACMYLERHIYAGSSVTPHRLAAASRAAAQLSRARPRSLRAWPAA